MYLYCDIDACYPVYYDFFSYLDPSTLANLEFLNIGVT